MNLPNMNSNSASEMNLVSHQHQINIQTALYSLPQMKLPCGDLVGTRDDYNMLCVPLYQASITGDWKSAKFYLDKRPELVQYSITENYETPLHIAVSAKFTKKGDLFVEELLKFMEMDDLELQNGNGETAPCVAAVAGNVKMAKMIVKKNESLLTIPDSEGKMPLCKSASYGKHDMIKYLYDSSQKMASRYWTDEDRDYVLLKCVEANLFDVKLLDRVRGIINSLIHVKDPPTEASSALKLLRIIWSNMLKLHKDEISDIIRGPPDPTMPIACKNQTQEPKKLKYSSQMLFISAEKGNKTFVVELIRRYPDLVRKVNDNNQSIFHVAVSHRRKGIYKLINEIGPNKDSVITLEDKNGNNMLHLAGERAKGSRGYAPIFSSRKKEFIWSYTT